MKKSRKSARIKLDRDEKNLLSSFEKGEWKRVANVKKEKSHALKVAAKTLRKDTRINIRLSSSFASFTFLWNFTRLRGLLFKL